MKVSRSFFIPTAVLAERSPSALFETSAAQGEDRLRELESKYDRLRRDLEATKRLADYLLIKVSPP